MKPATDDLIRTPYGWGRVTDVAEFDDLIRVDFYGKCQWMPLSFMLENAGS